MFKEFDNISKEVEAAIENSVASIDGTAGDDLKSEPDTEDKAVTEEDTAKVEPDTDPDPTEVKPEEGKTEEGEGEEEGGDDDQDDDQDNDISDELKERAVRAGMSLKEIADVPASFLERICDRLEGNSDNGKTENNSDDNSGSEDEVKALMDALPDFDSEEWEPEVGKVFKTLAQIVAVQGSELKQLRQTNTTASAVEVLLAKEGIADADKATVLTKYNVLAKGYESANVEMKPEDLLKEAMALSGVAEKTKKSKMQARSKMHISRPTRTAPPKTSGGTLSDDIADITEEIQNKYKQLVG